MHLKTVFLTATLVISSLGLAANSDFLLTVTPGLSAVEYARQSALYLAQARLEYGVAYADLPLYNRAIANAEAAVRLQRFCEFLSHPRWRSGVRFTRDTLFFSSRTTRHVCGKGLHKHGKRYISTRAQSPPARAVWLFKQRS